MFCFCLSATFCLLCHNKITSVEWLFTGLRCGKGKLSHCASEPPAQGQRAGCEGPHCCTTLGKAHYLLGEQTDEQTHTHTHTLLWRQNGMWLHAAASDPHSSSQYLRFQQQLVQRCDCLGPPYCVTPSASEWSFVNQVTGFAEDQRHQKCQVRDVISYKWKI